MFAVSISLGSVSAYVSVAPVAAAPPSGSAVAAAAAPVAPIKVIANSAGHRNTPVVAAVTEQEVLFGENAVHTFARQPQTVVPYLFAYSAAAAAIEDAAQFTSEANSALASNLLSVVEQGARAKYRGHCALEEREISEGISRHGFAYEVDGKDGEPVEKFASAEDLFVQFLNYVKEHSIDGACGLAAAGGDAADAKAAKKAKKALLLTIVVPRSAFPSMAAVTTASGAAGGLRSSALEWLADAVRASQLDAVTEQTTILFSDEAALLAFDSAPRSAPTPRPYFLLPASASRAAGGEQASGSVAAAAEEANVLVVDWGAHALNLTLLRTVGGTLVQPKFGVPYMSCAAVADAATEGHYCGAFVCSGGDALDVALADKVAANYMIANRRMFQSLVPNMRPLQDLVSSSAAASGAAADARQIVSETIPSRAMRRLRLLMGDKKIALNTNPQASSVAVEMEAFFEGMDLMDSQSLSRNKFEAAVASEWGCVDRFECALGEFVRRHRAAFETHKVNYVLLTGGMCQVPTIAQSVRRLLQSPRTPEVQFAMSGTVAVLDSSLIGNGVAADELFSVGGCLHSYHLARVLADREDVSRRLAKALKKKRSATSRLAAVALREEHGALAAAWAAMAEGDDEQEDNEENDNSGERQAETAEHAYVLTRSVHLLTDATAVPASTTAATVELPAAALTTLFAKGTVLPARVVCPLSGADTAMVCLFSSSTNGGDRAATVSVRPLMEKGVGLSAEAAGSTFAVFTLHTDVEEEGRRGVSISVQQVTSPTDNLPDVLTPANTTDVAEVKLQ